MLKGIVVTPKNDFKKFTIYYSRNIITESIGNYAMVYEIVIKQDLLD